ncbi:related to UGA4-GABA permease-also involved in delta-aminolevulinate transport [Fusarium fujikuroi]|uniref:Related to UGA4-GABA permease-also involved in delta-aminolevulinate transport n=1 Tax=Gibberella fujikuroi (strain CBS 195.34 / IMI 58289 / NRRL A-6831) TaxID=1279085 RepID=S0DPQ3_GIBF5|nr:related to UGA4-GABA permease-also involved in delta-aminolevulinate transport [Fusarium fujikuroi IMI 58289]KLO99333.1 UGA4-GABA permease-also involved in delta-aminolevulinate transport [Fusarium fujikuroi]KLP16723.1 UGA4-GABA permease-also involved in delta-aminolevulinate transport [Fusarium fujikuroi]CCT62528.1 related to UGA4-GABA permease-also involved in delta-aminolevulinate transport [Fusarium fujikuroi IMI 58289]SCN67351.1 related to UGA4-GABA permease-also involved in delta-amino
MASILDRDPDADKKMGPRNSIASDFAEDEVVHDFGYSPSYARVFRSLGTMSLTKAMASPMCGIFIAVSYQINYGGYWGLTWGWFIPSFLFLPWALTTAEFCSSMPVNGANYWWTAALAPPSIFRPLSFIAGMANIMNALTSIASFAWASPSSICTIIGLFTGWVPTNPIIFAVAIATCAAWFFTASIRMDKASLVFISSATLVLVSLACFVIGLPVAQETQSMPFTSAATVFGDYTNYIAPRSIINTYCLQAGMGMIFCTLLAFCITDMEAAASDPTGYAAFALLIERWGLKVAGAFLLIIFLSTSIGWGYALNYKLSYVSPRSNMPIYTTMFLTIGGMLMLCLGFSPIASETIYSLAIIAVMVLYALPMIFRVFDNGRWVLGPWNMGRFSKPVHVLGFLTVVYMMIMECFPPQATWTGAMLNYNWAVFLGAVVLSTLLWFSHGSPHYKGVNQEMLRAWREREHDRGLSQEGSGESRSETYIEGVKPQPFSSPKMSSSFFCQCTLLPNPLIAI